MLKIKCSKVLLVSLYFFLCGQIYADQDFSKIVIKTKFVGKSVSMLVGAGGNIGISSGKDGVFMIDDQFAPLTPQIVAAIQKISKKPIRFLLNTHWHFDHTGGNENIGKAGTAIIAHENVRKTMSIDQEIKALKRKIPAAEKNALPTITFKESTTFYFNDEEIRVLHVPFAHTDGDSIVIFRKANIIHTGDIFFNGFYPFIDTEHGGSIDGVINAVNMMLTLSNDKTKIIPGHGKLATRKELLEYKNMLVEARKLVKAAAKKHKTMVQIIASNPLETLNGKWGKSFIKPKAFIQFILPNYRQK